MKKLIYVLTVLTLVSGSQGRLLGASQSPAQDVPVVQEPAAEVRQEDGVAQAPVEVPAEAPVAEEPAAAPVEMPAEPASQPVVVE